MRYPWKHNKQYNFSTAQKIKKVCQLTEHLLKEVLLVQGELNRLRDDKERSAHSETSFSPTLLPASMDPQPQRHGAFYQKNINSVLFMICLLRSSELSPLLTSDLASFTTIWRRRFQKSNGARDTRGIAVVKGEETERVLGAQKSGTPRMIERRSENQSPVPPLWG